MTHKIPAEWWLEQAKEDLVTAGVCLRAERFYAAAFYSHQVAEKTLKWLIIRTEREMPYTHSLKQLAECYDLTGSVLKAVMDLAPEYGRAKCPYHAGGVPAHLCNEERARTCIKNAELVLDWAIG